MIISWTPASLAAAIMLWELASGSKRLILCATERAHQRGLAGSARPDDAEAVSGGKGERDVLDDDPLIAGRDDADRLDREAARRGLQQGRPRAGGPRFEQ